MKAIVVGAGIVGASVAYRLAQAGAAVTLVEERRIGGGTSGVTYAWVNACEKLASRPYFELNMAGRRAHAALAEELDGAKWWYHRPGVLQWQHAEAEAGGRDGAEPTDKLKRLQEWGYPAEPLDQAELLKLEPEISPAVVGNAPVIHYPGDGWADAPLCAAAQVGAGMERHDLTLRIGKVAGLEVRAGRCEGVRLADGSVLGADLVVNCAGRWSNEVAGEAGIPLAPTYGIVAYTPAVGLRLRRGLRTPLINLRPDGGGRLLLRSNELDRLVTSLDGAVPSHPQAQELLRRAKLTLPALGPAEVEAVRIGIRPVPGDSYSAVGPVPGLSGYYLAVTHSGVTLGPFLGQAIAQEAIEGREAPELAEFRPARFFR
ncbi:FAD-binding oxidoreductase [Roseomonas sp. OT10]|uniref:NAD(P)/FAD-dependent oxidoreductase n=1 Tax=Roseomonas cutis TaxID=2897332 RepID=UPI001E411196|nr:FAD-binding oxidoreductase [Roseomonas sp. OT10]UFN47889.1 FAD-binding oxidoreductase [Roseomonas sp. OT10]